MLEILDRCQPGDSTSVGLMVDAFPDLYEPVRIVWDRSTKTLSVDRIHASLNENVYQYVYRAVPIAKTNGGHFDLSGGDSLSWWICVHHFHIEIYTNGKMCLTSRDDPTSQNSLCTGCFANGRFSR